MKEMRTLKASMAVHVFEISPGGVSQSEQQKKNRPKKPNTIFGAERRLSESKVMV